MSMNNINELTAKAASTIGILENIAGYEPGDIDGDTVELRFEDEAGCDTGCDVSIVEQCQKAADVIRALTEALEAAEKRNTELEARTLTVKLPKRRTHEDYVDARFSNADLAAIYNATVTSYTRLIEAACDETGIKLQIEGE